MQVKLTIIKGPHQGKEFMFHKHANFFVGRGPQAHFRLTEADRFFSRLHFMVEVNPPACRMLDLNPGTRCRSTEDPQPLSSAVDCAVR